MAVSAQLVAATPQQANPDAKRSRAEQEAALALMSGKKVKTTMHSIGGKTHKNAHHAEKNMWTTLGSSVHANGCR